MRMRSEYKGAADLIIMIVLAIPAMIFRALVITKFWGWFVTPLHVPQIDVLEALGLVMLFQLFVRPQKEEVDDDVEYPLAFHVLKGMIASVVSLVIGWLYITIRGY